jgi:hypothetical protein
LALAVLVMLNLMIRTRNMPFVDNNTRNTIGKFDSNFFLEKTIAIQKVDIIYQYIRP